jgi:hypothetical protein
LRKLLILLVGLQLGVALAQSPPRELGVVEPKLLLPAALESRRPEMMQMILAAQRRLLLFARRFDWDHLLQTPLLERVEIFASKVDYDAHLRKLYPETAQMAIPGTFVAGFENTSFFAVAPEVYAEKFPKMVEPDFYEKLICHELAHKLHTRLVNGQEEKMGPIWFWEGFATYVAGQFEGDYGQLSRQQIETIMNEPQRGDYRQYNRVFRYFVKLAAPVPRSAHPLPTPPKSRPKGSCRSRHTIHSKQDKASQPERQDHDHGCAGSGRRWLVCLKLSGSHAGAGAGVAAHCPRSACALAGAHRQW